MRRFAIPLFVLFALLASGTTGCGDDQTQAPTTSSVTTTIPDTTDTTDPAPEATTGSTNDATVTTSDTEVPETTDATGQSTTSLPGTAVELFAKPGDRLGVIGVEHDDVLNVRSGPGVGFEIITTLGPTGNVVATGQARQIPGAFWYEIEANGAIGWANLRFLAYIGGVDDATSEIVAELGGEIPEAETMLDLGRLVADAYPRDEEVEPRITLTLAPTVGDLGEVTYDVIGLADDSLVGVRLHVFGQPTDSGEGFWLGSVERTALCGRGLAGEICV